MALLRKIDVAIDTVFDRGASSFSACLLLVMITTLFIEVVTRYVVGKSTPQIEEYARVFFVWIIWVMAGKVTKEGSHILVSLLPDQLTKAGRMRAKTLLDIAIHFLVFLFAIMMVYFGILDTSNLVKSGASSTFYFGPLWWFMHVALPIGGLTLMYYEMKKLVQSRRILSSLSRSNKKMSET
jgi:TRAP-type C4-dicarboxylate transport system permease small subunit